MEPSTNPPPEAQVYTKKSFVGGMNQLVDMTKIAANEYPLLFNGRTNFDKITPIRKPVQIISQQYTWTKVQGIFATDILLFVFADGKAYYKDISSNSDFMILTNFTLDPNVDEVFVEKVPASSVNSLRTAVPNQDNTEVLFTTLGQSYPSALIVQDGVSTPQIIYDDLTNKYANTYAQWSTGNREYIPIGKQMLFYNGILYVVSPDGKSLLHSVTGRPCDFMIVIDENGDKLATESEGDAYTVSFQFDFNSITALHKLNTQDGSFFASTLAGSYMITPIRDVTVFGEPTFRATWLFPTGVLNPYSFVDITGDSVFITSRGIRSFNAVYSTKWEGKNTPFSKRVYGLFEDVEQDVTAAILFEEEHVLFACKTIYGPCLVVYDVTTTSFESIDIPSGIKGVVKKFAQTTSDITRLFCITDQNEVFELYADTSAYEKCSFYIGEWISPLSVGSEQKIESITVVLDNVRQSGTFYATLYTEHSAQEKEQAFIEKQVNSKVYPSPVPFYDGGESVRHVTFPFLNSRQSWKVGFLLEFDFDLEILCIEVKSSMMDNLNCMDAQAAELSYYTYGNAKIESFIPQIAKPNQVVHVYGSGLQSVVGVFVGDITVNSFMKISDSELVFSSPNYVQVAKIKLRTVSNNEALSINSLTCIPA